MKRTLLLAAALLAPAAMHAGDCYRCTGRSVGPGRVMQDCEPGFKVGGMGCTTTGSTCWTQGACGTGGGVCDVEDDCKYDNPPVAKEAKVSAAGRRALAKRPDLLGALLRDMIKVKGAIIIGPIASGAIKDGQEWRSFTGLIKRLDDKRLSVRLDLEAHPVVSRIEAVLGEEGAHGEVSFTGHDGFTLSESW